MTLSTLVHALHPARAMIVSRRRRLIGALCAATVGVLMTGVAVSTQSSGFVPTYTGCYNGSSGTINKLSLGSDPLKLCGADARVAISAGDITAVRVEGGLTGGGDNGDVTIGLDARYTLPQGCPANFIPKWSGTVWLCSADNDTTYQASTGLELLASPLRFAIQEAYRLPQGCADGSLIKKQGSGWVCAPAPAAGAVFNLTGPDAGISDDGAEHTFLTLAVSPGTYTVMAKGMLASELNVSGFTSTGCVIRTGPIVLDTLQFGSAVTDDIPQMPIALMGAVTLGGAGTINLNCSASPGADGMALEDYRMIVTRVPVS